MPVHKTLDVDVAVVGGGVAGVCAALAAARHGARTALIQDRPVLGGNSSSEIRVHITGADCAGQRPGYRESGILEELRLEETVRNPERNACMWDLILWEKARAEPLLTLLLNAHCRAAARDPSGRIMRLTALQVTTETEWRVRARYFIDCTGHGTLGALAGADFRQGREGPQEHREPHAQGPDSKTMGASLLWCARDMGRPSPFTPPPWAHKFTRAEDLPQRLSPARIEHGHWWIEYGGELDIIHDTEKIRDELLACLMGVWDWHKNYSGAAVENWALTWWGFLPGHRESRRLLGPYIFTENDLLENRQFEDAIGHGGWPIDTHPPAGIFSSEPPCDFGQQIGVYQIPLRCLYSRNVPNLFMAGRDASCTHLAMASARVMGTCAVMGQAAGTAAAHCFRDDCLPGELTAAQVKQIQETLLRDDQYIPGLAAADPEDLARQATIVAKSEAPGCPAAAVTNGVTRALGEASNQWRSAPGKVLPQWLELRWERPVAVREVHLTFDTGFERPLCLTHSDSFNSRMIRGPQPETVKDYDLKVAEAGQWRTVLKARGNYQRKRVHRVEAEGVEALRLVVRATQGVPEARVFEVRVY